MSGSFALPGALPFALFGVVALLLGTFITSRISARLRAGRLLAGLAPIDPSLALRTAALRGHALSYVAVKGSVDATEVFEDEHHRPLVYRRERVFIADGRAWREIDRAVRSVPFSISDQSGALRIDAAALDEGLIVLERRWDGSVAELHAAERAYATEASRTLVATLASNDPTRGARLSLEQVSTLDRATAAGELRGGTLTAPGNRPLILTTLERDEALRVIGGERRAAHLVGVLASLLLALGTAAIAAALVLSMVGALNPTGHATDGGGAVSTTPSSEPSAGATAGAAESGDARAGATAVGISGAVNLLLALALPGGAAALVFVVVRRMAHDRNR